jgi:hypothetical protein
MLNPRSWRRQLKRRYVLAFFGKLPPDDDLALRINAVDLEY